MKNLISLPEIVVIAGLAAFGYGLYLLAPWAGISATGLAVMGLGAAMAYARTNPPEPPRSA